MYFEEKTIDDLMNRVFKKLLNKPFNVCPTRSSKLGATSEEIGNLLILKNPLARLSLSEIRGKPFSALGEWLWYLTKDNDLDFIKYYIPKYCDDSEFDLLGRKVIYGGYGPRLFKMRTQFDQIMAIINLLKDKPSTRKAVIQIFDAEDIAGSHKDVPCTSSLQFFVRDGKLSLMCTMRSNDAFWGFPHDVFCFTMLQELVARELGLNLGFYYHSVGSLHIYESHKEEIQSFLDEGFFSTNMVMPEMPMENAIESAYELLKIEDDIRSGSKRDYLSYSLKPYWLDLGRLLEAYKERRNLSRLMELKNEMQSKVFDVYLDKKIQEIS